METKIRQLLTKINKNRNWLASEVGGGTGYVYLIADGHMKATKPHQERIAKALGTTPEVIFDDYGMARTGQ